MNDLAVISDEIDGTSDEFSKVREEINITIADLEALRNISANSFDFSRLSITRIELSRTEEMFEKLNNTVIDFCDMQNEVANVSWDIPNTLVDPGYEQMSLPAIVQEGEAEAGAHVRREGGFIVEVIVHVAEQRGGIEGFLGGTVVAVPFLLAVAAESAFELDTQGEHVLGPEVIADGESSAKRELIVFVDAESAHAGALNSSGILKSHHEFGCQVHAVPGGSDIRKSEGAHKRKCNKKAFHISSRKICLCPAGFRQRLPMSVRMSRKFKVKLKYLLSFLFIEKI